MAEDQQGKREKVAASTGITKQEKRGRRVTSAYRAAAENAEDKAGGDAASDAAQAETAAPPSEVLAPGTKVGRYEVIRLVGEGGMGTVYEAMDARLNRKVALKILSSQLKSKRKAAKRFTIEAQAAARLVHPNVVGIFDFDVECAIPYMAMEYLQGETLAAAIDRGPLAFARMADIMLAVCAGVHAAHQAGIVHRDLKQRPHANRGHCGDVAVPFARAGGRASSRHRAQRPVFPGRGDVRMRDPADAPTGRADLQSSPQRNPGPS